MRTLAIGDIHGCPGVLADLLAAIAPTADDSLVFLGDYVDRGPDSRGVIDAVVALQRTHRVVCLRGNHEVMMLEARTDASMHRMWERCGGRQALDSYAARPGRAGRLADVPPEHWAFLEATLPYFETETHIFAHANLSPGDPLDEQPDEMLYWEFMNPNFPTRHVSGKTLICGHTSQKTGEILDLGTAVCIDTFAYGGGWLTGLDVRAERYWQANLLGKVRTGTLGTPRDE